MFNNLNSEAFTTFFFANLVYVAVTSFAKFVVDWLVLQDISIRYNKVEKQKLEAELRTLKAQVNPHFLFNSLNNIYSLALHNPEETPKLILMLSDLMRHVIYESNEDFVPLEKELNFVNNFMELQKLRINSHMDLQFNINGPIPANKRIVPLLFEPFIDNAFKHGLKAKNDHPFVHILFTFSESSLVFEIRNNYEPPLMTATNTSQGVGLKNVERRLEFLYRKDDYNLNITNENHVFAVSLRINLKDY